MDLSTKVFSFERLRSRDIGKGLLGSKGIDQIIKNLPAMKGVDDEFIPKFRFFQVKISHVKTNIDQEGRLMICFIDISQKILYDTSKAESELLSLINSTISHEMRNPLNSIINQC